MKRQTKNQKSLSHVEGNLAKLKIVESFIKIFHSFKPKIFFLLLFSTLFTFEKIYAQSFPPPITSLGDTTIRGMYVSCGDVVIDELKLHGNIFDSINNGSHTSATLNTWKLINFCSTHYIKYIALYSLAQRHSSSISDPIIGNPAYFNSIKRFLQVAHDNGIKVGIVITNKEFLEIQAGYGTFVTSPFYWPVPTSPWDSSCYNFNTSRLGLNTATDINSGANPPADSLLNPTDTTYGALELSEMLKGVLRVMQYNYKVRDFHDLSCADCIEDEARFAASPSSPPLKYLFDYMSLEYEYWDKATYKLVDTTTVPGMTKPKKAWNTFGEIAGAMLYVSSHMCGLTKNELELKIVPPVQDFSLTQPSTPWDALAQDMPGAQDQVVFITKYFHRILLSSYTKFIGNISKTASTHTRFSSIPSSLNPNDRNWIMPLFSAATVGVQKHCFDTLRFINNTSIPDTSDNSYYGPYLDTVAGASMESIESAYLLTIDYAVYFHNSPAYQFGPCNDYFSLTPTTCAIDTAYNKIMGFMWFNYSYLKDSHRSHQEYNRLFSPSNILLSYFEENNVLNIITPSSKNSESKGVLELFDIYGKRIYSIQEISLNHSYSLNIVNSGIYLCKVSSNTDVATIKVLLIK